MASRGLPEVGNICQTCGQQGPHVNITTIAMWDIWLCSKDCLAYFVEHHIGEAAYQYFYLVDQQKELLSLAKEFAGKPCECEWTQNGERMRCEPCYASVFK